MKTKLHTIHLKSGCASYGTTSNSFFTTNGIGKGGTIQKGAVRVDYLTSTDQDAQYGPGGAGHFVKVKCPSIPFTDLAIRCDDSSTIKRVSLPDQTVGVCMNQSTETSGGNQHFSYQNNNTSRDDNSGREFMNFNTANPLNIVLTDISDDAIDIPDWRLGLTFIEFIDEE